MDTYISTRSKIVKGNKVLTELEGDLQFKYDTLSDTLDYIKDLWGTTQNYVSSAEKLFEDLSSESTEASVNNLAIITSMGVGATLIGLFVQPEIPELSWLGVVYFFTLASIGFVVNKIIKYIYRRRNYTISDTKVAKDI